MAISNYGEHLHAKYRELSLEIELKLSARLGRDNEGLVVSAPEAELHLPPIISSYDKRLAFTIIPFCKIPFAMYDCVLARLLEAKVTVAAGVKAKLVFGSIGAQGEALHVVRIVRELSNGVALADDDFEGGEKLLEWPEFEHAVLDASSGYWVIGCDGKWRTKWI